MQRKRGIGPPPGSRTRGASKERPKGRGSAPRALQESGQSVEVDSLVPTVLVLERADDRHPITGTAARPFHSKYET